VEHQSILERLNEVSATEAGAMESPEPVRFPAEDGGRSLADMAERDLQAALQLLAERAQYITGASGAAIALREGDEMICRASAGPSAPELGAQLQTDSGLSGESIRTRQILRCDDAETDKRVNRESCRALGIASVVVMPLTEDEEVHGVFELFSDRAHAFEERDIVALQRIAEMIQTATTHAAATLKGEKAIAASGDPVTVEVQEPVGNAEPAVEEVAQATPVEVTKAELWSAPDQPGTEAATEAPAPLAPMTSGHIGKCQVCGFPVSEGRRLCLDCEKAHKPADEAGSEEATALLATLSQAEPGWWSSHKYLLGVLVVVMAVIAVLLKLH